MLGKRKLNNISIKINLEKRNFPEKTSKVVGDFSKYVKKAGVWACYGIPRDNSSSWVCLNVGQSSNIGVEMRTNCNYSKGIFNNKIGIYKNYKGEVIFTFDRPKDEPITSRQRVWNDIGKKYKCLYFVIVDESLDENERLTKEMEYAIKKEAIYWNKSPKQNHNLKKF